MKERGAERVGIGERVGLSCLHSKAPVLEDDRELGGERIEHHVVLGGDVRSGDGENDVRSELFHDVGFPGMLGHGVAGRRLDSPTIVRTTQQRGGREPEHRAHMMKERGDRFGFSHGGREPGERGGLVAGPRRFGGPAGGRVDEPAHDERHAEEHDERDHILTLVDGPSMDRGREVEVGREVGSQRGDQRGEGASNRCGDDDEREVEQQDSRQAR